MGSICHQEGAVIKLGQRNNRDETVNALNVEIFCDVGTFQILLERHPCFVQKGSQINS